MGGIVLGLIGFFFMGGGNHSHAGQFAYSGNVVIEGIPYTGSLEMSFSLVDDQGTQHWRSGESADDRIEVMVERGRYLVILGGQGMSPIPPDLLLDQPELYVHMSYTKDGVAELQTIPGRRVLSSHSPEGPVKLKNQMMPVTRCHLIHSGFNHLGGRFHCCVNGRMPSASIMIMAH